MQSFPDELPLFYSHIFFAYLRVFKFSLTHPGFTSCDNGVHIFHDFSLELLIFINFCFPGTLIIHCTYLVLICAFCGATHWIQGLTCAGETLLSLSLASDYASCCWRCQAGKQCLIIIFSQTTYYSWHSSALLFFWFVCLVGSACSVRHLSFFPASFRPNKYILSFYLAVFKIFSFVF